MAAGLWKSFLFGAVLAGAVGPIALLIFGTAARRGFPAGGYAGLGAALADLLYAFTAFAAGALLLPLLAAHADEIRMAGALLLIALGAWMLLRAGRPDVAKEAVRAPAASLLPTFLLTVVNPMTLVMFAGLAPQLPVAGSVVNAAWFAAALCAGSLAVQLAIAAAGSLVGAGLPGPLWQRALSALSGAGILAFGIAGVAGAR